MTADLPHPLASGGSRLVAKLIDTAIVLVVFFGVRSVIDDGFDGETSVATGLVTLMFVLGYEIGLVAVKGATVGKLALGLRIIDERGVTPPSVATASMRWLPNIVAIAPLVGPLVAIVLILASLIWVFTDPLHRSVFDRAARTLVVDTR